MKYFADPTFGGAVVNGSRNVFTTTVDFTGIAFRHRSAAILPGGFALARPHHRQQ